MKSYKANQIKRAVSILSLLFFSQACTWSNSGPPIAKVAPLVNAQQQTLVHLGNSPSPTRVIGAERSAEMQLSEKCGPEESYAHALVERPARWMLDSFPLTVYLDLSGLDNSLKSAQSTLVSKAFEAWQGVGQGVGEFLFVESPEQADIFWRYSNLSGSRFGEMSYWTDGEFYMVKAEVILDPRMMRLDARDGDLRMTLATATHEIGHILGINGNLNERLGHPVLAPGVQSIMLKPSSLSSERIRKVRKSDINTLRDIYCRADQSVSAF